MFSHAHAQIDFPPKITVLFAYRPKSKAPLLKQDLGPDKEVDLNWVSASHSGQWLGKYLKRDKWDTCFYLVGYSIFHLFKSWKSCAVENSCLDLQRNNFIIWRIHRGGQNWQNRQMGFIWFFCFASECKFYFPMAEMWDFHHFMWTKLVENRTWGNDILKFLNSFIYTYRYIYSIISTIQEMFHENCKNSKFHNFQYFLPDLHQIFTFLYEFFLYVILTKSWTGFLI